jgi:hypothetical protein
VLFLALIFSGSALAQSSPRRIDTGPTTGPETSGNNTSWSLVKIPGLEPGSTLGAVAVNAAGFVYVWALRAEPMPAATTLGADPRHEGPGDLPPTEPGRGGNPLTVPVSTLYQYNGEWQPLLQLRGERGVSIFIVKPGEMFASTDLPDGSVRVYHKPRAKPWVNDALPLGVTGPAGAFAGTERIFFRAGDHILSRHADNDWRVEVYSKSLATSGELVRIQDDEMMAPCDNGQFLWNGFDWNWHGAANTTHIHGAWGGRDFDGSLHLFATGCNPAHNVPMMWQFVEEVPGHLNGCFEPLALGPTGARSSPSYGSEVWGTRPHDVYATGCCDHCGRLMHFDGQVWSRIIPFADMPPAVGISGTVQGEVWVSLADGSLLYRPAPVSLARGPELGTPSGDPLPVLRRPGLHLAVRDVRAGNVDLGFTVPAESFVTLGVFDLAGRQVATLFRDRAGAGDHRLSWNAKGVPSGVYFCRFEAGQDRVAKRIVIHR